MFGSIRTKDDIGCSKNIPQLISDIKNITTDDQGFNIINEYACRYGFSKDIYNKHREELSSIDFEKRLSYNSQVKFYLILDCNNTIDFDILSDQINNLSIKPVALSMIFRSSDQNIFSDAIHSKILNTKLSNNNIKWKVHKLIENSDLEFAIDHVLSTNMHPNYSSHILVYHINDIDHLNDDINFLNQQIMLYQRPHIAILDKNLSLYRLCITFENYKVAKNLGNTIIDILSAERDTILY